MTWTADALTYSPDPPSYYGNIDFVGGGRMMAEFTDFAGDALDVGADLRMMFRIKAFDENRGLRRYFWKRSEEHTYELQSLMRISYDVFYLKNKLHITILISYNH